MVLRSDGKAAQAHRIGAASTLVAAAVLAPAFEHRAATMPLDAATPAVRAAVTVTVPPIEHERQPMPKLAAASVEPAPGGGLAVETDAAVLEIPKPLPAVSTLLTPLADKPIVATVTAAALPPPAVPQAAQPPALVADASMEKPIAGLTHAEADFAALAVPLDDRLIYIPQVSETVRAAYIAQVDAAAPEQRLAVRSGNEVIGAVQFQVADGVVSVNVGQVLDLFEGRFVPDHFAALRGSQSAQSYVSLDQLQGAGIPLEYNAAYDELTLDIEHG